MNKAIIELDSNPIQSSLIHINYMLKLIQSKQPELATYSTVSFSVKEDGHLIGGLSGWHNLDFSYIEAIWILETYQKRGLAKKLLFEFEKKSLLEGKKYVLTSTHSVSGSVRFWVKSGYQIIHETSPSDSGVIIYYLMKKLEI